MSQSWDDSTKYHERAIHVGGSINPERPQARVSEFFQKFRAWGLEGAARSALYLKKNVKRLEARMDPVTAIAEGNGTLRRDVIPYLSDLHHAIDNGRRDAALDILDLISTSITDVANLLRDTYRAV